MFSIDKKTRAELLKPAETRRIVELGLFLCGALKMCRWCMGGRPANPYVHFSHIIKRGYLRLLRVIPVLCSGRQAESIDIIIDMLAAHLLVICCSLRDSL